MSRRERERASERHRRPMLPELACRGEAIRRTAAAPEVGRPWASSTCTRAVRRLASPMSGPASVITPSTVSLCSHTKFTEHVLATYYYYYWHVILFRWLYPSPALSDLLAMMFRRVSPLFFGETLWIAAVLFFFWQHSCCPVSVHLSVKFTNFSRLLYISMRHILVGFAHFVKHMNS